ncbi:hypothetical protein [Pseudomonas sp. Irchel 3E13]|uniref:hypothetical protein n=1 Tax=Pseudomonas sp. Irchel 3E13 TaxID=2008975 RepID=UPI00117A38AC|nr:hypothetical protein [Pseudomonas sp. Irchel 3E13]
MFEYEPKSAEYAQRVIDERCAVARKRLVDDCPNEWRTYVISRLAAHQRQVARDFSSRPNHPRQKQQAALPVRGNPAVAARSLADIRATLKPTKEVHP